MQVTPVNSAASSAAALPGLLDQPGRISSLPQAEQIKAVAGQFESILLRQFMQQSVGSMMGGESGGPTGSVYGYLLTDVLASQLSAGGGLGLSKILQQQLTPRGATAVSPVAPLKDHP